MTRLPPFLAYLELGIDADERAIRRAYARRLKQIDPEADPQGFQALREAYENALQWQRWHAANAADQEDEEQADEPPQAEASPTRPAEAEAGAGLATEPAPAPPPAPTLESAESLGTAVFEDFARSIPQWRSEAEAGTALEHSLADERLISLDAKALFEWHVLRTLAEGWKPGHEHLFDAAVACFHWEQERRRLGLYGPVGAFVDGAINEQLMYKRQASPQQDRAVEQLRRDERPANADLMRCMAVLPQMMQFYPRWMRIVTDTGKVAQWRDQAQELAKAAAASQVPLVAPQPQFMGLNAWQAEAARLSKQAPSALPRPADPPRRSASGPGLFIVMILIGLVNVFSHLAPSESARSGYAEAQPAAAADANQQAQLARERKLKAEAEMKKLMEEARRIVAAPASRPASVPAALSMTLPAEAPPPGYDLLGGDTAQTSKPPTVHFGHDTSRGH